MKKIILLLFIASTSFAQSDPYVYFTANADLRNAALGSDSTGNKPEVNSEFKFGMTGQGFEVAIGYEIFPRIDYERYFISVSKMIEFRNLTVVPSIEPSIIGRSDDWGGGLGYKDNDSSHLSVGIAVPVRYHLNDSWAIEGVFDAIIRTDDMAKYRDSFKVTPSFRVGVVFKIPIL